ncbi:YjgB family protein [Desulfofalx alkaliphila]|uniref:YjgB family protein n=1 Tax=Desulfofalx alkaliphila TaxID=105483 RepID=UPI0004E10715|nr:YjgB family protein [Desulfofalx alkaliphila]
MFKRPTLLILCLSLLLAGGCADERQTEADISKNQETKAVVNDYDNELLHEIFQLAQQGKVINCEFSVESTVIDTVKEKWGEPDRADYIAAAKGTYATYLEHDVVFGYNKGSQIFDVRSYRDKLKEITLSGLYDTLGKPDNIHNYDSEVMLVYRAGEKYQLLFIFPKINEQNPDPHLDHYNVFYPRGTVNLMSGDPGLDYL